MSSVSSDGINNSRLSDFSPLLLKSIEKDVNAARTHLKSHVTTEGEILTLDENTEKSASNLTERIYFVGNISLTTF
jgi:hypothetical protein